MFGQELFGNLLQRYSIPGTNSFEIDGYVVSCFVVFVLFFHSFTFFFFFQLIFCLATAFRVLSYAFALLIDPERGIAAQKAEDGDVPDVVSMPDQATKQPSCFAKLVQFY